MDVDAVVNLGGKFSGGRFARVEVVGKVGGKLDTEVDVGSLWVAIFEINGAKVGREWFGKVDKDAIGKICGKLDVVVVVGSG